MTKLENQDEQLSYFLITHNNSLELSTDEDSKRIQVNLIPILMAIAEEEVGKEINIFFNSLIKGNSKWDLYDINLNKTSDYFSKHYFKLKTYYNAFNELLSNNYTEGFIFNKNNIQNLTKVLCFIYQSFKQCKKVYKIKTHKDLMNMYKEIITKKIEALSLFKVDNKSSFTHTMNNDVNRRMSYSSGISSLSSSLRKRFDYCYPHSKGEFQYQNVYLIEFVLLINKFQNVGKFIFNVKDISNETAIEEILIILLNREWLFPNINDISFDIRSNEIENDLESLFYSELVQLARKNKDNIKNTSYTNTKKGSNNDDDSTVFSTTMSLNEKAFSFKDKRSSISYNTKSKNSLILKQYLKNYEQNDMARSVYSSDLNSKNKYSIKSKNNLNKNDYVSYINDNSSFFTTIIIYAYFISVIHPSKFSLIFSHTFTKEIETLLQSKKVMLYNFTFLSLLTKLKSLTDFDFVLNALDFESFEKTIGIIYNSTDLQKLKLSLFTEENSYSPSALFQLSTRLDLDFMKNRKQNTFMNLNNNDIDRYLIETLLPIFEENLQKLFFVIQHKYFLKELYLTLDLPTIIIDNDSYSMLILKFVMNLMLFAKQSNLIETLSLRAPYLNFDSRKFPFIDEFFECMEGYHNIKSLSIQFQMYKVNNLYQLFSNNLQQIFIGDLDKESFLSLVSFIKENENEDIFNNLTSLVISLSIQIVIFDDIIAKNVFDFFMFKNIKGNMNELSLLSNMKIQKKEELKELFDLIYFKSKAHNVFLEIANSNCDNLIEIETKIRSQYKNNITNVKNIFCFSKLFPKGKVLKEIYLNVISFLTFPTNKGILCKNV